MLKRLATLSTFFVASTFAQAPIPKTPAGDTLQAWITAFNSADRAHLEGFLQKYEPNVSVDRMLALRASTGSLELVSIDKINRTHVEFRVRQQASSKTAAGLLDLTDAVPSQVVKFNFIGLQVIQQP